MRYERRPQIWVMDDGSALCWDAAGNLQDVKEEIMTAYHAYDVLTGDDLRPGRMDGDLTRHEANIYWKIIHGLVQVRQTRTREKTRRWCTQIALAGLPVPPALEKFAGDETWPCSLAP